MLEEDDDLGSVTFSAHNLYVAQGGPMELAITPPSDRDPSEDAGYLTINCRKATLDDMESLKKGEKKHMFQFVTGVFDILK